jgi:CubicO group peptidase (beta-lactamase class C family)
MFLLPGAAATAGVTALLLSAGVAAFAQTDDEVRQVLSDRIDRDRQSLGIVVGLIGPEGRRVIAHGDVRPDSLFEIGSITKVFTSLLLADMVERGELALDDPVEKYLPKGVRMPVQGSRPITLQDLATHMSGLPRLPDNLSPKLMANPYAEYDADKLYRFLGGYKLPRAPGAKWEYSNLATGLLGHVLEIRTGSTFETLVRLRIANQLDMRSTWVRVPDSMRSRLATGHNALRQPVPNWDWQALAGAGALWSSAGDMLEFLAANLGYKNSALAPAMAAMLKLRAATGVPNFGQALGWQTLAREGVELIWKDGGTFGFSSVIAFDPKTRRGVAVLSDTFTLAGVVDIGLHLLDSRFPLQSFGTGTKPK